MAPLTPLRLEAAQLIRQLDEVLGTVRILWLEAKTEKESRHWMHRLNQLLDQRSHLMRLRDSA